MASLRSSSKVASLPPEQEIETLRLFREHFGSAFQLRIDPNAIWSPDTSIRVIHKIRELDMEYVEDPTWGIAGMARVREKTDVPLSTNMIVTVFEHITPAVRARAVDVILCDHHYWGGLVACMELAAVCRTLGLGISMHSNSHLGISMAAMTHLGAAIPELIYACDTHYPWNPEDLIAGGKLGFEDGCQKVPSGPGLGVELDREALGRLHEQYNKSRQESRDDVSAMRRRDPGWLPLRPRW